MRQHQRAVDEVAEHGHQLVVVARLEILPREIVVLGFRRIGAQHVAQHVFLARKLFEVFVQPHRPVPRRRDLFSLQIQELVGRHVLRQDITAVRAQHRREHDAVENDVVLADEMHHLGVLVLPVFFPVGRQILGRRDVTDRRVEPHVQHLPLGTLDRNGNPPIQVAAHRAGLQSQIEPAFALPVHVDLPLLMLFEYPFAQKLLVLVQRQEPVRRLAHHRNRPGNGAVRIDQVGRAQRTAALLALIAVCAVVLTVRAGADDVAVGQKLPGLLVVILHRGLFDELSFVVQRAEKIRRGFMVRRRSRPRIDVERPAESFESVLDDIVVLVNDILRLDSLLARLDRDGHAVLVGTAYGDHVRAPQAQVPHIDVRRNVYPRKVSDMHRPVGIRERRCDKIAFKLFHRKGQKSIFRTKL